MTQQSLKIVKNTQKQIENYLIENKTLNEKLLVNSINEIIDPLNVYS